MSIGDEDDDALAHDGAEGEGAEGQDDSGQPEGGAAADLSAEQPDLEADDGEQEVEVAAPTRGQGRIQRLANEAKTAREERDAAKREAEELRRQQWQQQNARSEQEERERLALMTPDERADYRISQTERKFEQRFREQQVQSAATMDKVAYDAKATINPVYAQFKDEVEQRFQDQLRKGQPVERELILKLVLGERALSGARTGTSAARKRAQPRVESQRVASGSGRSDSASQRGRSGETPESRLKDVYI